MNDPLRFGDQSFSTSWRGTGEAASGRLRPHNQIKLLSLAMTVSAAVLLSPTITHAQDCHKDKSTGEMDPL